MRQGRKNKEFHLPNFVRSAVTGDLGFNDFPWVRLQPSFGNTGAAQVLISEPEIRQAGYAPEDWGMIRARELTPATPMPSLDLMVDMKSRRDIDIFEKQEDATTEPRFILGGAFQDDHPDDFWNDVHGKNRLIIYAGDTNLFMAAARGERVLPQDYLPNLFCGVIYGLMIRGYSTGVGTAMPGQ